jgi:hypothetical protein
MRRSDGHARSGSGHAVDAGPVLGVSALRPAFLDDVSPAQSRQGQARHRASLVKDSPTVNLATFEDKLDDDLEDDPDEDDEFDDDDDGDEEDEEDDEDVETWQVSKPIPFR